MAHIDLTQASEAYVLKGRGEIMEKLRMMEKNKTILNAAPVGEAGGLTTTIIKLVPEKGFLALDPSPQQELNQKLLNAKGVVFSAQLNGVETQFKADKLIDARLQGQAVLAAPIPTAVYWLQRRKLYRVPIPHYMMVKCKVPLPNEEIAEFTVLNVSLMGLALLDKAGHFRLWGRVGQVFENCRLYLQGFEEETFALEIRNKLDTASINERDTSMRVGFEFKNISRSFEPKLQKFMYEVERELKTSGL
jgi:c-di-GMP-binding flagellar brake protein YcgR